MTMRRHPGLLWGSLAALLIFLCLGGLLAAQTQNLPPKPDRYVTDQAGVLDPATADALNSQLEQFEKETSNQILVAIYPSLPPETDIAQYATYTYNAWGLGQKGKDNGAILFIFVNDHQMFIATGRGLEGALPDATCKNIVDLVIKPRFRQGDYAGGVQAGISAMIAAAMGEYTGNGSTVDEAKRVREQEIQTWVIIAFIVIILLVRMAAGGGGGGWGGPIIFTGGGWGGGYGGGGGGFGGGGGGFSGGGGSSAGGGAGGSW